MVELAEFFESGVGGGRGGFSYSVEGEVRSKHRHQALGWHEEAPVSFLPHQACRLETFTVPVSALGHSRMRGGWLVMVCGFSEDRCMCFALSV